jgi:uncharacterized membrane protein YjgN (DUF898 family)
MKRLQALQKYVSQHPVLIGVGTSMALVVPAMAATALDFRTATTVPTGVATIFTNAMGSVPIFTGAAVTLVAVKATIPLVAGLVRGMFSS